MLLNPIHQKRLEPDVMFVSDPRADFQAVNEASNLGIATVALCSTDNDFSYVDLAIPTNNKGRRALAVVYWLLARQILRERGEITPESDMRFSIEDFEVKLVEKSKL
jgi:small subunit ribosomal protein S2